ncbi:MAG: NADP-specific glutamate dehydrogenase, partial [Oscillospiraceae bacterium]
CDIAMPCATQNELDEESARALINNGVIAVTECANMPCTPGAVTMLQKSGVLFAPAKAANAGGVATSGLEMSQNSMRYSWSFDEVDVKLHGIMSNIFRSAYDAAHDYGLEGNLVAGANITGFLKISAAMRAQGVV